MISVTSGDTSTLVYSTVLTRFRKPESIPTKQKPYLSKDLWISKFDSVYKYKEWRDFSLCKNIGRLSDNLLKSIIL